MRRFLVVIAFLAAAGNALADEPPEPLPAWIEAALDSAGVPRENWPRPPAELADQATQADQAPVREALGITQGQLNGIGIALGGCAFAGFIGLVSYSVDDPKDAEAAAKLAWGMVAASCTLGLITMIHPSGGQ